MGLYYFSDLLKTLQIKPKTYIQIQKLSLLCSIDVVKWKQGYSIYFAASSVCPPVSLETLQLKLIHTHTLKPKTFSYRLVLSWSAPRASSVSVCPPHPPGFLCGVPAYRKRGRSSVPRDPWNTPLAWVERQSQYGRSRLSSPYCFHCPVKRQQRKHIKVRTCRLQSINTDAGCLYMISTVNACCAIELTCF